MARQPTNRVPRVTTAVFTAPATGLNEAQIKELKDKFGLDVRVRSHAEAVDRLIGGVVEASSYDRTHPGYDRSYDKDPDVGRELGELIRTLDLTRRGGGSVGGGG